MTLLAVRNVTKRFGGLIAVNDASFTVEAGRIVALIGPNGAGKTTLFAAIAGFLKPDAGSIQFEGADIAGQPPPAICRLGIARTFQIVQPFAGLSVRENIAVGAHLHLRNRGAALDKAGDVARRVGMAALLDRPAADLTVAGRKRLELARALATEPKLLLLDEVMAGLIPAEIAEIVETIRDIRAGGVTILMIEHVMQAVMRLSDWVHVLAEGRMIAQGAPESLADNPAVVEAYLGAGAAARMLAQSDVHP
jgi:branched-chain amino acid transport system ATP-binding protein